MSTIKQRLVASKILENGGNVSKAMREAGYSVAMAKNPHKLTGSKGWKTLMNEYLPEDMIAQSHAELLFNPRKYSFRGNRRISVIDNNIRAKALDLAYKVRGLYKAAKVEFTNPLDQYRDIPMDKLEEIVRGKKG